jgi:murein DD-endopeptidase MepM/ murein hydrolase activator NlpD
MTLNLTTRADVTVGRYEALPTAMSDHDVPAPRRFSRRSALIALAATAGAIAVGDAFGIGAAGAASGGLDDPGSALATARRMRFDPTTTIPTTPGGYGAPIPPATGKLMFPLGIPTAKSSIYVLDNFGDCRGSRGHAGVDILATGGGNPIFAVADGELTQWYTNTGEAGWGWTLFSAATNTTYKYFHMQDNKHGWNTGSRVKVGDVLGFVGSSGTDSDTNFHLHLEVRPNNVPTNPLPLIDIPPGVAVSPSPLHACIGLPML